MPTMKMQDVERRYGKPVREVLKDLFVQHGNINRVANELGVSQSTVSNWLMRLNMRLHTVVMELEVQ